MLLAVTLPQAAVRSHLTQNEPESPSGTWCLETVGETSAPLRGKATESPVQFNRVPQIARGIANYHMEEPAGGNEANLQKGTGSI